MLSLLNRLLFILLLTINIVFIHGCAITSHGRMARIKPSQVDTIQVNVTTKEEILEKFGNPQKITSKPNGIDSFIYAGGVERHFGIPFMISFGRAGGSGQTLSIIFKDDIVIDYEFAVEQREMFK